jgi:hypothetical protein
MTSGKQYFKQSIIKKALIFKQDGLSKNDELIEYVLENDVSVDLPIKQVCAKLTESLSKDIDRVSSILSLSKRKFIELAIINAISEFDEIAEEYSIYEYYDDLDNKESE